MITQSSFRCNYLIVSEIKHLFMYLRDFCIFLSVSSPFVSFPVLPPPLHWTVCLLLQIRRQYLNWGWGLKNNGIKTGKSPQVTISELKYNVIVFRGQVNSTVYHIFLTS